jgi:hypothetical protein
MYWQCVLLVHSYTQTVESHIIISVKKDKLWYSVAIGNMMYPNRVTKIVTGV